MKSIFLSVIFSLLIFSGAVAQDKIPALNKEVIKFVDKNIAKTVGRGECWDLAAQPLNELGCKWDKAYEFGTLIKHTKKNVYPGDIIQFKNVELKIVDGNMTTTMSFIHHTAIVYEVKGKMHYIIAEQNSGLHGRKVGLTEVDFNKMTKGTIKIYRPTK